ncbi:dihydropteridine reductase [Chryseobacterium piperi]|uniref:Flavohemoprotein n=1 Tax=Chryseobacterium piperi TaxID=558152 RepID=A0A086B720_9FLAO|nr:NO-inducible flavohemoprotein [Chryseobacterium piperi]ASW76197.1 NO-inducible flavohemoprotein [Chryseobacterium piperi]KFF24734.1 dihydropteridine reductase [Chryseobacterium piperi]
MNDNQKKLVKATVPVLKTNGTDLTKHFYTRMFKHNPELKNIFNMSNQASGKQQHALAGAVLAYAEHIENPGVLIDVLKSIGNKHVSLNITPEQYDIVGLHLISSIQEVLGEAANTELIEAWTQAYNELAQIMISIEDGIYKSTLEKNGGWKGWRAFIISDIIEESSEIKSFYLQPKDGKTIADYLPGQYISIKTFIPSLGYEQPRQYSLSSAFMPDYYRISVKKEKNTQSFPDGVVSNVLHQKAIGDEIWVSAPAGVFHANPSSENPLVLISGGVGITPLLSMLETNKNNLQKNTVVWLHSCRDEKVHAFKNHVNQLNENNYWLTTHIFYENLTTDTDIAKKGRIDLHEMKDDILIDKAKYYICGPEAFIKAQYNSLIQLGVSKEDILYEEFGPQLLHLN